MDVVFMHRGCWPFYFYVHRGDVQVVVRKGVPEGIQNLSLSLCMACLAEKNLLRFSGVSSMATSNAY